jgi:hypothetical protein
MSVFMTKEWQDGTSAETLETVPVSTGVYEIADRNGTVIDIGVAGALEPFGLRSKLRGLADTYQVPEMQFRFEEHVQYQSRYVELVLSHASRHGEVPAKVAERGEVFRGRLALDH